MKKGLRLVWYSARPAGNFSDGIDDLMKKGLRLEKQLQELLAVHKTE